MQFIMISELAKNISPSPTLSLNAKVNELKAQGEKILNFTAGEPDMDTPAEAKQYALQAIESGFTKYTAIGGIDELKSAVVEKFKLDNNIDYTNKNILISSGAKQILYNAFLAVCNPGDEVILALPTWTTYIEQITLVGAKAVLIDLPEPFKLKAADIEKMLTSKTKVILLNSPCNPTGVMIDDEELVAIAELALKHDLLVFADEIYEKVVSNKPHNSIVTLVPAVKSRTVIINGVSKSHSMTGWRIGYAAGPEEIITAMTNVQGQTTSNPTSIAQFAALGALKEAVYFPKKLAEVIAKRKNFAIEKLAEIPDLKLITPDGAFYLFMSIRNVLKEGESSAQWCERLLTAEKIALVPGEAFLAPGYVRMSLTQPEELITEAFARIANFIRNS